MATSTIPAIEVQALLADPSWPTYRQRLLDRRAAIVRRLSTHEGLDHAVMSRLAGEIKGLDYALGIPDEMRSADPRSET